MATTAERQTPVHLWIVGIIALLWNAFGCYDYLMTRMQNRAYLESMMPGTDAGAILAWVDAFPIWAQFGWGLGVWGGLIGAVLLLVRHRWAVWAFALSLLGAILGLGYQLLMAPPPPGVDGAMAKIMPIVIILVAAFLFLYSRSQEQNGVLR